MHRKLLDGTLSSSLNWDLSDASKETLYELDLGLFDGLPQPLGDQGQFRSLGLVLQHFAKEIWEPRGCKGVCLYSGAADFPSLAADESDALARADMAVDYINLLTTQLPFDLPAYVDLDLSQISDPLQRLRLLAPDRYEHLEVLTRGLPEHICDEAPLGVLLPAHTEHGDLPALRDAVAELDGLQCPYRIVAEPLLIMSWAGLDELVVDMSALTPQGRRQVDGFLAAGGQLRELSMVTT